MKRFLSFFLLVTLSLSFTVLGKAEVIEQAVLAIAKEVPVYQEMSEQAKEIASYKLGELVYFEEKIEEEWFKVKLDGQESGYIHISYVAENPYRTTFDKEYGIYIYGRGNKNKIGITTVGKEYDVWKIDGQYWIITDSGKIGNLDPDGYLYLP